MREHEITIKNNRQYYKSAYSILLLLQLTTYYLKWHIQWYPPCERDDHKF